MSVLSCNYTTSAVNAKTLRLRSTAARLELKGIDGSLHKRWSMWFNLTIRVKPYQILDLIPFLIIFLYEYIKFTREYFICGITGVAWLSSARVVRCLVNSFNERNFGYFFHKIYCLL